MSGQRPQDDGSKQTPAAWQDEQTSAGWQGNEPLDPDDLPWTVAPTSVPPDMSASERHSTAEPTVQMPAVPAPAGGSMPPASTDAPKAKLPSASDATVIIPRDPSGAGRGRRRRGDTAKRVVAQAIGIAKVSYPRPGARTEEAANASGDAAKKPAKPPVMATGGNGSVFAVFAILGVLIVSGIAAVYMTPKDNTPGPAQPGPQVSNRAPGSPSASPSLSPVASPASSPQRSASASPRRSNGSSSPATVTGDVTTARADDCFVDNGTETNPNMQKVTCRTGVLKVLKRIDGTSDMAQCRQVATSTNYFSFQVDGAKPTSFVLCMRVL